MWRIGLWLLPVILAGAHFLYSQERQEPRESVRIAKIVWEPTDHKLTWEIQRGRWNGETFIADSSKTYTCPIDEAFVESDGNSERFSPDEAALLHQIVDVLTRWVAVTTAWHQDGKRPEQQRRLD